MEAARVGSRDQRVAFIHHFRRCQQVEVRQAQGTSDFQQGIGHETQIDRPGRIALQRGDHQFSGSGHADVQRRKRLARRND